MGREIRRVPKDWQHPTYKDLGKEDEFRICKSGYKNVADRFHPMFNELFKNAMEEWYKEWKLWENGEHPDQKKEYHEPMSYVEWDINM